MLALYLGRKLCRSLGRKMPDPTKIATKAADKVFSSADSCNSLLACQRLGDQGRGLLGRQRFDQRLQRHLAVEIETGSGRNDVAHDDVFLEAAQVIDLAHAGRLRQHPGGVLERRGAQETFGFERGLGNAQQDRLRFGRFAAHFFHALVLVLEGDLVDLFAPEEGGVARLGDANLAQHLADDDFDVFVVDGDALEAIDLLHLVDEVLLQFLRTADVEYLVRHDRAFGQLLAFLHIIALENDNVLADGNEVFLLHAGLGVLDENAPLAADARAEIDRAINLRYLGGVLGTARLEEFRHPRQTAGDILGLRCFARCFGQEGAGHDPVAFADHDVSGRGNGVVGHDFALFVGDDDLGMEVLLVLDDDHGLLAGGFIGLFLHRHALDDVVESDAPGFLRKNRDVVRVPLHEGVAPLDLAAVGDGDDRADHDVVSLQFASIVGQDGQRTVLVQHDVVSIFEFDQAEVVVANRAVEFRFDLRLFELALG